LDDLGAAQRGRGEWADGLAALRRSLALEVNSNAYARYFAAIAEHRVGNAERPAALFREAEALGNVHDADDGALARLRDEAAVALGGAAGMCRARR